MGKSQFAILKKILRRLKRYVPALIGSLLLATVYVAMSLYIPILVGRAIDCIVSAGAVDFVAMAQELAMRVVSLQF